MGAKENKRFYKLGLHEEEQVGHFLKCNVLRVPGGWIYEDIRHHYMVFVPFNNEFMKML